MLREKCLKDRNTRTERLIQKDCNKTSQEPLPAERTVCATRIQRTLDGLHRPQTPTSFIPAAENNNFWLVI